MNKTLTAKADNAKEVLELCKQIVTYSEEEAKSKDKGILEFKCMQDSYEPNVLHFWERYESNVAMGRHNTSPEIVKLYEKIEPLLEGPMGMAIYEYEDGKIGMASVQCGPKGEGGLDDATGASGAAGGASYKQTSRAFDLTKVSEHEELERDNAILAGMSGKPKAAAAAKAGAAGAGAGAAPATKLTKEQLLKQLEEEEAKEREGGPLGGLLRAVASAAQGLGKCVAHYASSITGKK